MKIVLGIYGVNPMPASDVDGVIVDGVQFPESWIVHEQDRMKKESERKLAALRAERELARIEKIRKIKIDPDIPLDLQMP